MSRVTLIPLQFFGANNIPVIENTESGGSVLHVVCNANVSDAKNRSTLCEIFEVLCNSEKNKSNISQPDEKGGIGYFSGNL